MARATWVAVMTLVAALALYSSKTAFAGPPDERSSAMKLDKVEDGLCRYHQQKTDDKRVEWLNRLAPSHDPRVEAALRGAMSDSSEAVATAAAELLADHYGWFRPFPKAGLRLAGPPPPPPPRPPGPPET